MRKEFCKLESMKSDTSMSQSGRERRQAVLYVRVSSRDQEKEGFSIPAQIKLLQSYASGAGFSVAREFSDVETAKQAGRTGFTEMVTFLKRSSCRIVLVEKTDRLYRNQTLTMQGGDFGVLWKRVRPKSLSHYKGSVHKRGNNLGTKPPDYRPKP